MVSIVATISTASRYTRLISLFLATSTFRTNVSRSLKSNRRYIVIMSPPFVQWDIYSGRTPFQTGKYQMKCGRGSSRANGREMSSSSLSFNSWNTWSKKEEGYVILFLFLFVFLCFSLSLSLCVCVPLAVVTVFFWLTHSALLLSRKKKKKPPPPPVRFLKADVDVLCVCSRWRRIIIYCCSEHI